VDQARAALAIKSDYGLAHMTLGLALKNLGKLDEAEKELREAVRCNPDYAEMHLQLAYVLDDLGRADEACMRFGEALRLAPAGAAWKSKAQSRLTELQKVAKKAGG
jgi:Flp pilus assembly protein TadD